MKRPRGIVAQLRDGYRRAGLGWRRGGRSVAVFDPGPCRHVLAPLPTSVSPLTPASDLRHALEPLVAPRVCIRCELVPLRPGGADR